jgi:hypothetical protein
MGKYKQAWGDVFCTSCPADSTTTSTGASDLSKCQCNAGYTAADGGTCSACPVATFKAAPGSAACTVCPANSSHALTAQTDILACQCSPGAFGPKFTGATVTCSGYNRICGCSPSFGQRSGTISSGPGVYQSNSDCEWLISAPEEVGPITLTFTTFDMTLVDWVVIRRCTEPSCGGCVGSERYLVNDHSCSGSSVTEQIARLTGSTADWISAYPESFLQEMKIDTAALPDLSTVYTSFTGYLKVFFLSSDHQLQIQKPGFRAEWRLEGSHKCTGCPVATYASNSASTACAPCPKNSTSLPASANVTACLCDAGFGGTPGGPCALCAAGTYELGDACLACPANADSMPGSVSATACLCRPGYFGPPGGPCRPCPIGTFSRLANSIACHSCARNMNTSAPASSKLSDCLCVPGHEAYGLDDYNQGCFPCKSNSYKTTLSIDSCRNCPPHSTSPPASTSIEACACLLSFHKRAGDGTCARVCAPGFEPGGANLDVCVGCRPGFYKTLEGDDACTPCPPNSFSLLANQTSVSSCICQHGYIFNATTQLCDTCPPGSFNNQAGETQCFACVTEC